MAEYDDEEDDDALEESEEPQAPAAPAGASSLPPPPKGAEPVGQPHEIADLPPPPQGATPVGQAHYSSIGQRKSPFYGKPENYEPETTGGSLLSTAWSGAKKLYGSNAAPLPKEKPQPQSMLDVDAVKPTVDVSTSFQRPRPETPVQPYEEGDYLREARPGVPLFAGHEMGYEPSTEAPRDIQMAPSGVAGVVSKYLQSYLPPTAEYGEGGMPTEPAKAGTPLYRGGGVPKTTTGIADTLRGRVEQTIPKQNTLIGKIGRGAALYAGGFLDSMNDPSMLALGPMQAGAAAVAKVAPTLAAAGNLAVTGKFAADMLLGLKDSSTAVLAAVKSGDPEAMVESGLHFLTNVGFLIRPTFGERAKQTVPVEDLLGLKDTELRLAPEAREAIRAELAGEKPRVAGLLPELAHGVANLIKMQAGPEPGERTLARDEAWLGRPTGPDVAPLEAAQAAHTMALGGPPAPPEVAPVRGIRNPSFDRLLGEEGAGVVSPTPQIPPQLRGGEVMRGYPGELPGDRTVVGVEQEPPAPIPTVDEILERWKKTPPAGLSLRERADLKANPPTREEAEEALAGFRYPERGKAPENLRGGGEERPDLAPPEEEPNAQAAAAFAGEPAARPEQAAGPEGEPGERPQNEPAVGGAPPQGHGEEPGAGEGLPGAEHAPAGELAPARQFAGAPGGRAGRGGEAAGLRQIPLDDVDENSTDEGAHRARYFREFEPGADDARRALLTQASEEWGARQQRNPDDFFRRAIARLRKSGGAVEAGRKPFDETPYEQQDLSKKRSSKRQTPAETKADAEEAVAEIRTRTGKTLRARLRPSGIAEVGDRIADEFDRNGLVSFKGLKVGSTKDLAVVAQVARDPRFETFRIFAVRDGEIVGVQSITSRLPATARVFESKADMVTRLHDMGRWLRGLNADTFYMSHNHPSGDAEPSPADQAITKNFWLYLGDNVPPEALERPGNAALKLAPYRTRFGGHVVIDHGHYGLITIDPTKGSMFAGSLRLPEGTAQPTVHRDMPAQAGKTTGRWGGPQSVAQAARGILEAPGYYTLIHTAYQPTVRGQLSTLGVDAEHGEIVGHAMRGDHVQAVHLLPKDALTGDVGTLGDDILKTMSETGSQRVWLVANEDPGDAAGANIDRLLKEGVLAGVVANGKPFGGEAIKREQLAAQGVLPMSMMPVSGERLDTPGVPSVSVEQPRRTLDEFKDTDMYHGRPFALRGAPESIHTMLEHRQLVNKLTGMAKRGEIGRMWYEDSSKHILDMMGGDKEAAEKYAQLLAIFSPTTPVRANWRAAARAWAQWQAGEEIDSGKYGDHDRKASALLYDGENWEGRKTNNFYNNLMSFIDPSRVQGSTIDVHIMRALTGSKEKSAPTDAQYDYAEKTMGEVAKRLGWGPHQAQAAIWTTQRYLTGGRWKTPYERWVDEGRRGKKPAMTTYDFTHAAKEHEGAVDVEATPTELQGSLEPAAREELTRRVAEVVPPEDILRESGLLVSGPVTMKAGYWGGESNPSITVPIQLTPGKGKLGETGRRSIPEAGLDAATEANLKYALARLGYIYHQEAVAAGRDFPSLAAHTNSREFYLPGGPLSRAQALAIGRAFDEDPVLSKSAWWSPSEHGFRVVANDKNERWTPKRYEQVREAALDLVRSIGWIRSFDYSDARHYTVLHEGGPDGAGYEDLLRRGDEKVWAHERLDRARRQRTQALFDEYRTPEAADAARAEDARAAEAGRGEEAAEPGGGEHAEYGDERGGELPVSREAEERGAERGDSREAARQPLDEVPEVSEGVAGPKETFGEGEKAEEPAEPFFHSAVKRAVEHFDFRSAPGKDILNRLRATPGVKPDELDWLGLPGLLSSRLTITKQELLDHIDRAEVKVLPNIRSEDAAKQIEAMKRSLKKAEPKAAVHPDVVKAGRALKAGAIEVLKTYHAKRSPHTTDERRAELAGKDAARVLRVARKVSDLLNLPRYIEAHAPNGVYTQDVINSKVWGEGERRNGPLRDSRPLRKLTGNDAGWVPYRQRLVDEYYLTPDMRSKFKELLNAYFLKANGAHEPVPEKKKKAPPPEPKGPQEPIEKPIGGEAYRGYMTPKEVEHQKYSEVTFQNTNPPNPYGAEHEAKRIAQNKAAYEHQLSLIQQTQRPDGSWETTLKTPEHGTASGNWTPDLVDPPNEYGQRWWRADRDGKRFYEATKEGGLSEAKRWLAEQIDRENPKSEPSHFVGGHWNEPDVFAHGRMAEAETPTGEKALHIGEFQSDLHQKAREAGNYRTPETEEAAAAAKRAANERFTAIRNERDALAEALVDKLNKRGMLSEAIGRTDPMPHEAEHIIAANDVPDGYASGSRWWRDGDSRLSSFLREKATPDEAEDLRKIARLQEDYIAAYRDVNLAGKLGPPEGPLKKSWNLMVLKYALRKAIDSGKDLVTFSRGEQNADVYGGLRQEVKDIRWQEQPDGSGTLRLRTSTGRDQIEERATREEVAKAIGKEMAERLFNEKSAETNPVTGLKSYEVSGDQLSGVDTAWRGRKGMMAYYNNVLPAEFNKYLKRYGAKVEEGALGGRPIEAHQFIPKPEELEPFPQQELQALADKVNQRNEPNFYDKSDEERNAFYDWLGGLGEKYVYDGERRIGLASFLSDVNYTRSRDANGYRVGPVRWGDLPKVKRLNDEGTERFVDEVGKPRAVPVHSIRITPELRDAIKGKSQDLWEGRKPFGDETPEEEAARDFEESFNRVALTDTPEHAMAAPGGAAVLKKMPTAPAKVETLAPAAPEPGLAKRIGEISLRARLGESARRLDSEIAAVSDFRKEFDHPDLAKPSPELEAIAADHEKAGNKELARNIRRFAQQIDFIDRLERGTPQADSKLDDWAKHFIDAFETRRQELVAEGMKAADEWKLETEYFGRIWKDPEENRDRIAAIMGRAPLEGGKGFAKHRSLLYFVDGLKAGLEPVSWNPVDVFLLKSKEMDRYIVARRFMADLDREGLRVFHRLGDRPVVGWRAPKDSSFKVYKNPDIPIHEAFDKDLMDQLEKVAEGLGATVTTKVTGMGRGTAGGRRWGSEKGGEIARRFGGPEFVVTHEIGHVLQSKYGLYKLLTRKLGVKTELSELGTYRYGRDPQTDAGFRDYVNSPDELIANLIHALVHTPGLAKKVAPNATRLFKEFAMQHPEARAILDVKPGLRLGEREGTVNAGGIVQTGEYLVPEQIADLIDRHLTPSQLANSTFFNAYRQASHGVLMARLGWSGFHLGFTTSDAVLSRLAAAGREASRGNAGAAMTALAHMPKAFAWFKDNPVLKEWYAPGSQGEDMGAIVKMIEMGGGRARQPDLYGLGHWEATLKGLRQEGLKYPTTGVDAALHTLGAGLEMGSRYVLNSIVPRQKMAIAGELMRFELEALEKETGAKSFKEVLENVDQKRLRDIASRVWDSVDNRLGQFVYENMFLNRTMKDILHATIQSVGWNLGTMRELGGGVKDVGKLLRPEKDVTGKALPRMSHRLAYTIMLPFFHGLLSSLIQYGYTGESPKDGKDLMFPRNGKLNPDGSPQRLSPATYMKDVYAYLGGFVEPGGGFGRGLKQASTTIVHKVNPLLSMIAEAWPSRNEDFYGREIRHPEDPWYKQIYDLAKFFVTSNKPYTAQSAQRVREAGGSWLDTIPSAVGLPVASANVSRSAMQQALVEYQREHMPRAPRTSEEAEKADLRKAITSAAHRGDRDAVADAVAEARQKELIPEKELRKLSSSTAQLSIERQFSHLPLIEAIRIFKLGNADEQKEMAPILAKKLRNRQGLEAVPLSKRVQLLDEGRKLLEGAAR